MIDLPRTPSKEPNNSAKEGHSYSNEAQLLRDILDSFDDLLDRFDSISGSEEDASCDLVRGNTKLKQSNSFSNCGKGFNCPPQNSNGSQVMVRNGCHTVHGKKDRLLLPSLLLHNSRTFAELKLQRSRLEMLNRKLEMERNMLRAYPDRSILNILLNLYFLSLLLNVYQIMSLLFSILSLHPFFYHFLSPSLSLSLYLAVYFFYHVLSLSFFLSPSLYLAV